MFLYLASLKTTEEQSKFLYLYSHYKYTMLYTARSILSGGYAYLAEDAVHEAFLKLAANMELVGNPAAARAKSLVVVITKHKAIDLLRRERYLDKLPLEDDVSSCSDKDSAYLRCEQLEALTEALKKIGKHYKIVIELKYIFGYTDAEIASLLDLTPKNVNVRLFRAKKKLRSLLAEEEVRNG